MKIFNKNKGSIKQFQGPQYKKKNSFSNNSKTIESKEDLNCSYNQRFNKNKNSFSTINSYSKKEASSNNSKYEINKSFNGMSFNYPPIEKGALSKKSKILKGGLNDSLSKQMDKSNNNENYKSNQIINKQNKYLNQFLNKPTYQNEQNSSSSILSQEIHLKFWDENDNDNLIKPSSNHSLNLSKYIIKNTSDINSTNNKSNLFQINNKLSNSNIHDYSTENRRLCVEFIKTISSLKLNKYKNISLLFKENSLSESIILPPQATTSQIVLTQKAIPLDNTDNNNNSAEVFLDNQPPLLVNYLAKESSLLFSNFLKEMNDKKREKLQMINYLMIPRQMNMEVILPSSINTKKKQSQIISLLFLLSPSILCYLRGIESYVFKWSDINTLCFLGGFDLIKMTSCLIDNEDPTHFIIETFDGEKTRTYKIDANNLEQCSQYVKNLSYLSQLIKCKVFSLKHTK